MAQRLQLRRGLKANLPTEGMLPGEAHVTIDRGTLHVAKDAASRLPIVPAIEDLVGLSSVDGLSDFLIIHDASEDAGQKEKKITFANLKAALNIPDASTDEKTALVSGGTSGYLYGTDGADGILRMGSSMSWEKDSSNNFVTFNVSVVDGGTF